MAAILSVEKHLKLRYILLHCTPFLHPVLVVDVPKECQYSAPWAVPDYRTPVLPKLIITEPNRKLKQIYDGFWSRVYVSYLINLPLITHILSLVVSA